MPVDMAAVLDEAALVVVVKALVAVVIGKLGQVAGP
jgi:hypothetical protein